jgi:hypothetical protein
VSSGLILHLDAGNPASYPGSGTTWTDLSGNGNNAVASGSPTYIATNGGGFNFDNATDYFDITPNMRESYASAGLSVAAWVKATSFPFPYVSTIMGRGDWNNNNGWALRHSASSNTISGPRFNQAVSNSFAVNVNILYYVIFTISPSGSAKMYINGVQNGSTSTGVVVPTASSVSPVIGRFPVINPSEGWYPWVGDIYQIHVYNRELSSAEIAENFWVTKFRYGL